MPPHDRLRWCLNGTDQTIHRFDLIHTYKPTVTTFPFYPRFKVSCKPAKRKTSLTIMKCFSLLWRSFTPPRHFNTCLLIHTWTCTSHLVVLSNSVLFPLRAALSCRLSAVCVAIISHGLFSQIIYSARNGSKFSWHLRGSADKKALKIHCSENAKRMNHIPAHWTWLLARASAGRGFLNIKQR